MVNVFVNRYNGKCLNGLQVNERVLCREFTKSLIFRDFDDILKNPSRYMHLFHTLIIIKKIPNIIAKLQSLELRFEKVENILPNRFFSHVKQPKTR